MKRSIFIVIAVLFAAFSARAYAVSDAPDTSAASAIVMHSGGEVIYEKNADAQSLIASTTKLMTAIVAIENCGLDDELEAARIRAASRARRCTCIWGSASRWRICCMGCCSSPATTRPSRSASTWQAARKRLSRA